MPDWLQFLADHKSILWLVLCGGVLSILNSTIFYTRLIRTAKKIYGSAKVRELEEKELLLAPVVELGESLLEKRWLRVAGIVQGLVFVAAAVAGLVLL